MPELVTMEGLHGWRARHNYETVVATNGCFDVLHVGHLACLEQARRYGDKLIVGINDDAGVVALKGETRPINPAPDRAEMLLGLRCVDAVCVFPGTKADEFLHQCRPNVYVKGGDYDLETLDSAERAVLEQCGAEVFFVEAVQGKSTTQTLSALGDSSSL